MTNLSPVNVGVIGIGNISSIYLEVGQTFEILKITAVADLVRERAESQAEHDLERYRKAQSVNNMNSPSF